MFPGRFFPERFYAPRFFPKVGAALPVPPTRRPYEAVPIPARPFETVRDLVDRNFKRVGETFGQLEKAPLRVIEAANLAAGKDELRDGEAAVVVVGATMYVAFRWGDTKLAAELV